VIILRWNREGKAGLVSRASNKGKDENMNRTLIKITKEEDLIYMTPQCELIEDASNEFDQILRETCEKEDKHIVLDFNNVEYFFSRTVSNLVHCYKLQHEKNKEIVIINATENLSEFVKAINLSQIIPVFNTFKEFLNWTDHIDTCGKSPAQAEITFENREGISIVRIKGMATMVNNLDVKKTFDDLLRETEKPKVVIDLGKVAGLDSASMGS
jgi:anti-anti-sigma factor